ncbi:MAG: hypothetical protein CMO55_08365 [Verrucomicrobiales bacterium]|nr:hypothetical protein [Verrucomicrobiales bacterium]
MLLPSTEPAESHPLFQKLTDSPLFQTYKTAFRTTTGLDLHLIPAHHAEKRKERAQSQFRNAFCNELSSLPGVNDSFCACCRWNSEDTLEATPHTYTCPAGLSETAVPVRNGDETVAILTTGYVFVGDKSEKTSSAAVEKLHSLNVPDSKKEELFALWRETDSVEWKKYEGIVTILTSFAVQLSVHVNRIVLENSNSEPRLVQKAKQFVTANIDRKITLAEVAEHVGVSTFYFCKVFKKTSGMTLTEYVNRRRIEIAKLKLINPEARVIEIAYETGFQSLSQFNRSFRRYVGQAPTEYRKSRLQRASTE